MAAAAAREYSIKLLITSVDCNPKAELSFPDHHTAIRWNAIVNALNLAKYSMATRRLELAANKQNRVAFLSLQASKKVAFLHSYDSERKNQEDHRYEISYDETLMDELPSFYSLRGLPRFHRFEEMPEDLQSSIIGRLDAVGFSRMKCVSRHFSRLTWNRDFNTCMYTNPGMKAAHALTTTTTTTTRVENFLDTEILIHFASGAGLAAAAAMVGMLHYFFGNKCVRK